jgi:hypothetical protein
MQPSWKRIYRDRQLRAHIGIRVGEVRGLIIREASSADYCSK